MESGRGAGARSEPIIRCIRTLLGALRQQWPYFPPALASAFAIPDVEAPTCRAASAKASPSWVTVPPGRAGRDRLGARRHTVSLCPSLRPPSAFPSTLSYLNLDPRNIRPPRRHRGAAKEDGIDFSDSYWNAPVWAVVFGPVVPSQSASVLASLAPWRFIISGWG